MQIKSFTACSNKGCELQAAMRSLDEEFEVFRQAWMQEHGGKDITVHDVKESFGVDPL